ATGVLLRLRGRDDLGGDGAHPLAVPGSRQSALTSPPPGLCIRCRHARPVTSARGSTFWRCGLSEVDPRFPKYPRLPVEQCSGFEHDPPLPSSGPPEV